MMNVLLCISLQYNTWNAEYIGERMYIYLPDKKMLFVPYFSDVKKNLIAQSVSFGKDHDHEEILKIEYICSGMRHCIRQSDQDIKSHRVF